MKSRALDEIERPEKTALENAIKSERRAVLVVNTRSRRGQRLYHSAKELLAAKGIILDAAYPVKDPARLPEIVAEAVAEGHRFIIVGGGDGTISSIVDRVAYRDVVLGILPLGTANSFARTIGIPLDIEGAVDVLCDGRVADIDLGKVNEDYFANAAAIGLPASIGRAMPPALKRWLGRAGYLLVAVTRLIRHQSFRCKLTEHGRTTSFDALEVRISNGNYQGGVLVAEEASVESRDLVVHVIKGTSAWTLAVVWLRNVLGLRQRPADLDIIRTADLLLETHPAQYVSIDGEAVTQTPVRISVAREALLLMVPSERTDLA